jgi:hypothetical protein
MAARAAAKLFPAALAGAVGYGYYNVTYKRSSRQYEYEPGCAPDESLSPQPWINHAFKALLPTAISEKAIGNFMLHCEDGSSIIPWTPPSRAEIQKKLRTVHYDVLVIGGGATGSGVALDATTRGLKTAMVEQDDFASGTSSRSTKLIHGGIRYLALAFQSQIPPKSRLDLIMHLHYDHSMMQVRSARRWSAEPVQSCTQAGARRAWCVLLRGRIRDMVAGRVPAGCRVQ